MKKELLYQPKHLQRLSKLLGRKIVQKEQERRGMFGKIKKVFK